jgi:hypothetical protein
MFSRTRWDRNWTLVQFRRISDHANMAQIATMPASAAGASSQPSSRFCAEPRAMRHGRTALHDVRLVCRHRAESLHYRAARNKEHAIDARCACAMAWRAHRFKG